MSDKKLNLLAIIFGLIVGFINGFFGGGGGMICVPVLLLLFKMPIKVAHATAIAVILPISLVSGIFYFFNFDIDIITTLIVAIGVIVGGIVGAKLLNKLPNKVIGIIFSLLMVAAGIKMVL